VQERVRRSDAGVGSGAGPFVLNGGLGNAGADGVQLDVSQGDSEVGFVHEAGVVAVSPELAAEAVVIVGDSRVLALEALHHGGESVVGFRFDEQVDVIRHERVADDADFLLGGVAVEEREVEVAIVVAEEDVLAEIAALGNVLRESGGCEAWHASHR